MKYIIERNNYDGNGWRHIATANTKKEAKIAVSNSIHLEEMITGSCFSNHRIREEA